MAATSGGLALLLTIFLLNGVYSQIPDKRLCADSSCKGVISFAIIKESYVAKNERELDLNAGSQVAVTSKNAQESDQYWGGEINGKYGYFPASYVQEQKVFNTNPKVIVSTQTHDSNDFSDLAKAFDEMTKANANQAESSGTPPPVASQSTDPPKSTGATEETEEEEEEGEEGDEEYEDEEGDEEGDEEYEEEEGDETESEAGTQPDGTEAANDPTEAAEQQTETATGTKPEETKPEEPKPAETKPEEKQAEAAESATPAPPEAEGGLLSSIGNMFGGMFGGKQEAPPSPDSAPAAAAPVDAVPADTGAKEAEAAEQPAVPETDVKAEAEKSETPEVKTEPHDPTEAAETAPATEEEGVDDKLRTIQEEQLAKIRSNFLRRRTQPSGMKEDVDDINKLLDKKYKRMEQPIQRRAPNILPTDGGSTVNAGMQLPDPEQLKEGLAAQQAEINKELEQQKKAELNRQWEIELVRRRQEELRKAQEKLLQEEMARKAHEEAAKKAQEAAKKAQEEAAKKDQEEAAKKVQEEAAKKAQEEAARKAHEEAVKKVQEDAARKAQEEAVKRAQEVAAKKVQEEAAKKAQEEAAKKAQAEAARKAQEEAARKAREEAAKKAQEEAARKAQEEAAKKAQEEAAKKAQEEAAKKAQEEAAKKAQEEAAKKAQEEAAKKAQDEAARKAQEEAAKKAQEEAVKKAQEEAVKKAQEEAAKKTQEEAAKKAQEEAAKKLELEMQAAKLRDEQLKQKELQKQKQQQGELLRRQEEMRREKEIQRNLQQQQKASETKVQDGGQPVVAPNQHPPLGSTQPGNVPGTPVSAMPTTREGAEPPQQSIVDDMALPHGSTTGKGSGETPEVQVTEALTQPPASVSIAAPTTTSSSPVLSQQPTLSDVTATAVPTPTPPNTAGGGNNPANHAPQAQPDAGLLQPSTPTPADNIRPSVTIVPATDTTEVPGNPTGGTSPGEDSEEPEEGFEEAEEGEEEEEGGEEEDGEEEEEAAKDEDNAETEKPVQPTPTQEQEEMERTITGADGLRSVVFDGTTMPLEDEPIVAPTVVLEVTSSIPELSPSMTEQVMTATPPLEASLEATYSSAILSLSDMPSPSPSEMLSQHTEQVGGEAPAGEGLTEEGMANATGPTSPNGDDQHIPTPAWEQKPGGQDDPYMPGEFMSRRFLQSETVDTPEMLENMKNEQLEGSETISEPDHEPVPPVEERMEPEGQEDPASWEEPLPQMVTPSAPDEEDPLPPTDAEDFGFLTPPTITEEEEQKEQPGKEQGQSGKEQEQPEEGQEQPGKEQEQPVTEASGGVVGNFVGALDGALQFLDPLVMGILGIMPSSVANFLAHEPFGFSAPRAALISLFAFSFLTLGIVSYCMTLCGGKRRDPLAKVSALEDKLFVTSKERDDLLQTVDKMKVQIEESRNRSTMSEGGVQELKSKLQTVQLHMAALQNTSTEQEMKIKELTSQNAEYAEVVTAKDGQLEQYMYQVNQYSEQLNATNTQLQESWQAQVVAQEQTASFQVQVEQLTEEVTFLTESKDQLQLQLEGWSEKVTELTEEIKVLTEQQKENEKLLAFKDSEMEVMRDCFLQLKAMQGAVTEEEDADNEEAEHADGDSPEVQEKIKAMMDVSKVNASLKEVTEERDTLKQRLKIEVDARKEMEDDMEKREKEIENLREGHRQAEVQSQEATTKLNVLASYFKEKEVELQTSLGEHVVKSKESQDQLMGVDDKVKRAEEEMASYRAQVEDLKKEIENVERDFRAQVATNEKKAHENWLAARQAERDLKESKNEAAMLRQKLLDMERKQELSGPAGLIRPLPTRAMPPPGVNGPPPPGMMPLGPPPLGPSPHAMGDRPMSRGTGIPPSPHMRDDHDYMPPPMRGRPPMMMDRPPPPPGSRASPPPRWSPGGRGRSPPPFDRRSPPFDRRSPPPFDRRSPPPFDRRGSPPPFDRRGPPPPHDRRSPPPMFRGPPPPDRRGPPPPGYRSPDGGYRRTPPHGRPYPPDQPPPPDYRKGGLDPRASDPRMDPRTSSPYDRPSSSASRNPDIPPQRNSQNMI